MNRHELWFDLTDTIGWLLGGVVVLFARPIAWAMFHDWSSARPSVALGTGPMCRALATGRGGRTPKGSI